MRSSLLFPLTSGLSLAVSGCVTATQRTSADESQFVYRTEDGKTAILDTAANVIRSPYGIVQLANCSDVNFVCFNSTDVRIEIPRSCATGGSVEYIRSSPTLNFLSLEGLSGNIFKAEAGRDKFGYGYHFGNGIVQLMILPPDGSLNVSTARQALLPHIYRIVREKGPFPCKG